MLVLCLTIFNLLVLILFFIIYENWGVTGSINTACNNLFHEQYEPNTDFEEKICKLVKTYYFERKIREYIKDGVSAEVKKTMHRETYTLIENRLAGEEFIDDLVKRILNKQLKITKE